MEQKVKKNWIVFTLILSFLITIFKFSAFYITKSNAILSDAAESIMNIVASTFALYSVRLAFKPKDLNHPYGHGKVEFFALGFEGALIIVTGFWILYKSIFSFFYYNSIKEAGLGAFIVGVTGLINWILGRFLIRKGKELKSITLFAEGKHLLSDTLSSGGIVIGLIIILYTRFFILDSFISLFIGFLMLYNGYSLARRSVAGLMDEADEQRIQEIISILDSHRSDNWIDIHNLRVQTYGESIHIDAHLTLPYYFDLKDSDKELQELKILFDTKLKTEVEIFFQTDPCDPACCNYCRKTNCTVRSEKKTKNIVWNYKRLVLNQKHYL